MKLTTIVSALRFKMPHGAADQAAPAMGWHCAGAAAILAAGLVTAGPAAAINECAPATDPSDNGAAADSISCTGGVTHPNGIAYVADGDLTLTVPGPPSSSANITLPTNGVDVTAFGADSLTWDSSAFTGDVRATGPADAVLDFRTDTGDIAIRAQTGGNGRVNGILQTTYGIRAHSGLDTATAGDGGDIEISGYRVLAIDTAIDARTDGGNIRIQGLAGGVFGSTLTLNGIYAETSGGGAIEMNVAGGISGSMTGIHAIADGDIAIDVSGVINGNAGVGVLMDSGSTATLNLLASTARLQGTTAAVRGLGQDVVVNVLGMPQAEDPTTLSGRLDFTGLAGTAQINVGEGAVWQINTPVATASTFSSADHRVHLQMGGRLTTPTGQGVWVADLGGGDSLLVNEGLLQIESTRAELQLLGLGRFENSGIIDLGEEEPSGFIQEDAAIADDILMLPGTTLVGTEAGRIRLDADLRAIGAQNQCDASLRGSNGRLPAADCIALHNGRIEGTILIELTPTVVGGRGSYDPEGNVLIDLSDGQGGAGGGGLAEGALVAIAPESGFYNPALGGIIDNGMLAYRLIYDEASSQVKLVGLPSAGAFHQPIIANAAQSAWRTANGSFFDRQADLRDTLRASSIGDHGVWVRTAYDMGERSQSHTFSLPSGDTTYDNTHDLDTSAVTLGVDLIRGGQSDQQWLVGGMVGYVRTDMAYAQFWTDTAAMNGMLAGLYASYLQGPMFVDIAASGIWTQLDQDMPQAEFPGGRGLTSNVTTLGVQAEGGWRFDLSGVRVEPLLNAAWASTGIDDFKVPEGDPSLPGNQVMFEDTTSMRLGAGLRGSTEFSVLGDLKLGLSLTGRFMNEGDGEAKVAIGNLNPISPEVVDTWDGSFTELTGGLTLANSTGRVSGVLNIGTRSGDDYSATSASASFRYQW